MSQEKAAMTQDGLAIYKSQYLPAIASSSLCNATTTAKLRQLLGSATENGTRHPGVPQPNRPKKGPPRRKAAIKESKAGPSRKPKATVVKIYEEEETRAITILKPQEKSRVAMEVLNTVLKSLTESIKARSSQRTPTNDRAVGSPVTSSGSRKAPRLNTPPLHPRSANIASESPNNAARGPCSNQDSMSGVAAQAECACLALATLRGLQDAVVGTQKPGLQLEMGSSALIGKFVALGFDEFAINELRILKCRLMNISRVGISKDRARLDKNDPSEAHSRIEKGYQDRLEDLLHFEYNTNDEQMLELVITTQLQALRLVLSRNTFSIVTKALPHIQPTTKHSIVNSIDRLAQGELPDSRNKAARHMSSLMHLLLEFCPISHLKSDGAILDDRKAPPPHTCLQIQVLALEIEWKMWRLRDQHGDPTNEIMQPLIRCLRTFISKSTLPGNEQLAYARDAVRKIVDLISTSIPVIADSRERFSRSTAMAYRVLADLAHASGRLDDARIWLERSLQSLKSGGSAQAALCEVMCQGGIIQLKASAINDDYEPLAAVLQNVIGSLLDDVQGDSAELDELLITVNSLRKISFLTVSRIPTDSVASSASQAPTLEVQCIEIVLLSIAFIVRFVGTKPRSDPESKSMLRFYQRRDAVRKIFKPNVESVIGLGRLEATRDASMWERVEIGLRHCAALAFSLENDEGTNTHGLQQDIPEYSPYVQLSNAYWCRYLRDKSNDETSETLRSSLAQSIELLRQRTRAEKINGFLPTKLERLGSYYQSKGDFPRAIKNCTRTAQVHMELGVLIDALPAAATRSLSEVLDSNKGIESFIRVLQTRCRIMGRTNKQNLQSALVIDDLSLSMESRTLLFELQMRALISVSREHSSFPGLTDALDRLANALLDSYVESEYPIRRLRLKCDMLRLAVSSSSTLRHELVSRLLQEPLNASNQAYGADVGLKDYEPHLLATRTIWLVLLNNSLRFDQIRSALQFWCNMVDDAASEISQAVDDIPGWTQQLELLAEYLELKGQSDLRLSVLQILTRIPVTSRPVQTEALPLRYIDLSNQYLRVGLSGKAGASLQKAQKQLEGLDVNGPLSVWWHIHNATYMLEAGNSIIAEKHLSAVSTALENDMLFEKHTITGYRSLNWTRANFHHIQSIQAFSQRQILPAIYHAKRSLKHTYVAWTLLERENRLLDQPGDHEADQNTVDCFVNKTNLEDNGSTSTQSGELQRLSTTSFWPLVPCLVSRLIHLFELYANEGLYQEAQYYVEKALTIASAVSSTSLRIQCLTLLGDFEARSAHIPVALQNLQIANTLSESDDAAGQCVSSEIKRAGAYSTLGNWDREMAILNRARSTLKQRMTDVILKDLAIENASIESLEEKMKVLQVSVEPAAKPRQIQRRPPSQKLNAKETTKTAPVAKPPTRTNPLDYAPLLRLQGAILRQEAYTALMRNGFEMATSKLNEALNFPTRQQDTLIQAIRRSQLYLRQALECVTGDPVLSALPESTISIPSSLASAILNKDGAQKHSSETIELLNIGQKRSRNLSVKDACVPSQPPNSFYELLDKARECMVKISTTAQVAGSSSLVHCVSDELVKTLMLLSAISRNGQINPAMVAYVMEMGRVTARNRQIAVMCPEILPDASPNDSSTENLSTTQSRSTVYSFHHATFQSQYIDVIPSSWNVFSLSLNAAQTELRISKLRAREAPFILVLPLDRHHSRDADENLFGFVESKVELQEIISLANNTSHEAVEVSKKGAKTAWWNARTRLDARLKDLLVNIENIWIGGFKGIFVSQPSKSTLLSRFHQSFVNILEKHLPSKQKSGKATKSEAVALDPKILELFTGLGPPDETEDFEEPLLDLLYYVIDILQFHGERNAYDEIDFDPITVETMDALRYYHQAVAIEAHDEGCKQTLLILDKSLHCFPWESMPCLAGHSISRVPSLACIRSRVLTMQQQNVKEAKYTDDDAQQPQAYIVDRSNGSYILNPGGDLTGTQSTFENALEGLSGWNNIVHSEPSEADMKQCLTSREIFLYFGHGSGGQYIRARTIQRLDSCAVSLLMGCSSGTLTEVGEYEPYGTPLNYLQAGCPAVVATLWDVTDKDIDRFSKGVLESWGLIEVQEVCKSDKSRGKRSGKAKASGREPRKKSSKSLSAAVAENRDKCILKYLNGAAPVIYGVPVVLG